MKEDWELLEAPCPRCGAEAACSFPDETKDRVEVVCADCGTFEMPIAEFERAEGEMAQPEERDH
ncbi:MAG: hypothetical protein JJE04_15605 [Acidobacteriia bacterium]|nr:hypothetical protein [Terriglobia bacterium]